MGYQPLPNCDACPSSDFLGWGARCFGSGGRRPRRQAGTLSLTQRRAIALQPAACICNKLQICIYIYMHILYNHIRHIHTCMYACMHTYLRTCIHTYVHTYMRACMHTDIHTYILPISGMLKALHVWWLYGLTIGSLQPMISRQADITIYMYNTHII